MKRTNAVKSYVNAVNKLTAAKNPFEDTNDKSDEPGISPSSAAVVRPRYGMYIAAAVLLIFLSVGTFIISNEIETETPQQFASGLNTEYSSIPQAIETYTKADRRYFETLEEFKQMIIERSEAKQNVSKSEKAEISERLTELDKVRQEASDYISKQKTDEKYYLLDAVKYEDEGRYYLTVINKTDKPIKVLRIGTVFDGATNEKLCSLGVMVPRTLEPDKPVTVIVTPTYVPEVNIRLSIETDSDSPLIFDIGNDELINTLSRENIQILEDMLSA